MSACNSADSPAPEHSQSISAPEVVSDQAEAVADTANDAAAFFSDLPRAKNVEKEAMGDLYFKILVRSTAKLNAVRNEESAKLMGDIVEYASAEVATLVARVDALPEDEQSRLFQDSVAQLGYAKRQYARAVEQLAEKNEPYLRKPAEDVDISWPTLR